MGSGSMFFRTAATLTAGLVGLLSATSAAAGLGDKLTYSFNSAATGSFSATTPRATLVLTETASGVDFLLTPDFTLLNRVERLQFVYSGDPVTFVQGAGAPADTGASQFGPHTGSFDASYTGSNYYQVEWFNKNADKFDSSFTSSAWSLNGTGVDLSDFSILGTTTNKNKPTPIFGIISVPGGQPNNWVAGEGSLIVANPVPEPSTYALMIAGLAALGFVARRRSRR